MNQNRFNFLFLQNYPIYEQLQLEEALLRNDDQNWCIINEGSPKAIVLGISGNPEHMIDLKYMSQKPVPLIRRFSGGGTVFVDENTHFVTFIGNSEGLKVPCTPLAVLEWTKKIYSATFKGIDFMIKENDYAIGVKKFGGNAQYMRKNRWLHHSSLLWDYDLDNMNYLLMPQKTPKYREKRTHQEFLCSLKSYLPNRKIITERLKKLLMTNYGIAEKTCCEAKKFLDIAHRQTTAFI